MNSERTKTMKESPIFTKFHDLMLWLFQALRRFPRDQRPMSLEIHRELFAVQKLLISAALLPLRKDEHLQQADIELKALRKNLLICYELGVLSAGQLHHVTSLVAEVGAMLGAWLGGKSKEASGRNPAR